MIDFNVVVLGGAELYHNKKKSKTVILNLSCTSSCANMLITVLCRLYGDLDKYRNVYFIGTCVLWGHQINSHHKVKMCLSPPSSKTSAHTQRHRERESPVMATLPSESFYSIQRIHIKRLMRI